MVTVSQDEVQREMAHREETLTACVRKAFADMKAFQAERHPNMRVRARRTLLQDLVVRGVDEAYSEAPDCRVIDPKTGRYLLSIANRFILQVKYLTREFKTVNALTETAKQFNAQGDLAGMPSLPRITLGYRLDKLETDVEGVYLLFAINNEPVWWYRIDENGEGITGAETLPLFPVPPASGDGVTQTPKRRVTPKAQPGEEGTKVIPMFGRNG